VSNTKRPARLASWHVIVVPAGGLAHTSITQKKPANTFALTAAMPGFGQRLVRVHANCYENIPLSWRCSCSHGERQTAVTDPRHDPPRRASAGSVCITSTSVPVQRLRLRAVPGAGATVVCWLYQFLTA
jgi:hypothetical protein